MENFLKSTKGYINSFRSTDDSKRNSSKQTLSTFSPTFVGDVYEKSVEVQSEENYLNTTDNIYSSPEYKLNPDDAEAEHDTSEALEDTELAEYVQALNAVTTFEPKTLSEKPSEETETTSSLNSASSSIASPSHEEFNNEADQEDSNSVPKTERENDRSPSPSVEGLSSTDLKPDLQSEETDRSESVESIDDFRDNGDGRISCVKNAEHLQLDDCRSLSESASFQQEDIQQDSTEILAALSFLQQTEEKDPSEQPSQVEASDSTEIVGNLSRTKSVQPIEAELLGPSDEVEENNTPDDEVSFPDLVALISEIETSFDEVENKEVDCISQDEESYNTAFSLPQSDTDSLREGVDPESKEQTAGLSFESPLARAKSPSEDIPDLALNSEEANQLSFEDQATLCISNVSNAHLRELESLARQVLKGSHESDSNLCVENPFEASQELPTELVELELATSESKEPIEFVTEEGSVDTVSDTNEVTKSISEQSESGESIVVEETIVETRSEESALADDDDVTTITGAESNEQRLSEESSLEELAAVTVIDINEVAKSDGSAVAQDREVSAFTEPDFDERTQPEDPVAVEEAQEAESSATEEQAEEVADVTVSDFIEQSPSEEPVLVVAEDTEPPVTEEQVEEVTSVSASESFEPTQPSEQIVGDEHAEEEEVVAVSASNTIEQSQPEEQVVTEEVAAVTVTEPIEPSQPEEQVVTEESVEEVAAVTVIDSIEPSQPEEQVVTEESVEEVAAVTVIDSIEPSQPEEQVVTEESVEEVAAVTVIDSIEPSQPEEQVVTEESVEEVAANTETDYIEPSQPEEQVVTEEQAEEVAAVTVTDSIEQTEEPVEEVAAVTVTDSIEPSQPEEQVVAEEQAEEVAAVTVSDSIEQTPPEEPIVASEEVTCEDQSQGPAQAKSEAREEATTETQAQELSQKEGVAAVTVPNEQTQPEEIDTVDTKTLKEENMQVRDAGFAEEKKDEDDIVQASMEHMETSVAEAVKSNLQMSTPETGSISPPKAEGRDDDRSETSDVAGLLPEKSDSSVSGTHSSSVDDAIDTRRAKSEEMSFTPQRDRSIASQGSPLNQDVSNQTMPRTPLRTKSPPRERSKTPVQDRPELEKQKIIPKKKLTEYIRKDLWNRKKPDLVLEAINAVAEAAIQAESRSAIARAGGLLALIRAMEDHVNDVAIQIASCIALERLALDPENEIAIAEIGGVDAVLGAMMCHFKNAELHEAAWSTLWNLTCVNSAEEMTIDTAGGMQAIVSCMKQHINNPMVQKNACGALTNLCLHSEARLQALSDAGGFVAISSALQKHFKNMEVRKQASFALTSLLETHAGQYEADHGM